MRTLAIDCATEACSVALFQDDALVAGTFEVLGRGHAERLVPMIAELPEKGRADRVLVSLGPGSFTGVRIGVAAARALGLAWQAEVFGYPTLALVAAIARNRSGPQPVTVCMTGGHGEWFVQDFGADGIPESDQVSISPEDTLRRTSHTIVAGSKAEDFAALARNNCEALVILPDSRCALSLPDKTLRTDLSPIYGRAPDAKLPGAA